MPSRPLSGIIESFKGLNVLIVGDAMLDQFSYSKNDRISPETHVPVYSVYKSNFYPGGAANVAVIVKALGATPFLVSPVGRDSIGGTLRDHLKAYFIEPRWLIPSKRVTTHKHRFFNEETPVGRIDFETNDPLSDEEFLTLRRFCEELISKSDLVILQDYNKGCLTPESIPLVLDLAKRHSVPVIVDPKKENIELYSGADMLKPNRLEAEQILGSAFDPGKDLDKLQDLSTRLNVGKLLITLGKDGMIGFDKKGACRAEGTGVENAHIVGAGDAATAIAGLLLALGGQLDEIVNLSNLFGGLYCSKAEMIPVYYEELAAQVLNVDNDRTFD